jgi:hypothetical protein
MNRHYQAMKLLPGVLVLLSALGCGAKVPLKEKGVCPTPGGHCNTYTCGGNSAIVNAFPINGLSAGACSPEGTKLMPSSMDGGECKGMTLELVGDKLVGKASDGRPDCEGDKLKNTTFAVGSHAQADLERIEITEVLPDWTAPNGEQRTAYRLEWTKETEKDGNGKRKGLCSKEGQKFRHALGLPKMFETADLPEPGADLVIVVSSEIYDEEGILMSKTPWNHLACVTDALAKRSLYKLEDSSDLKKNQTAIRMLTADYCGATAWTVRGEWIAWMFEHDPDVEAEWDENGAKCLSAPRLLRDDSNQPAVPPKQTEHIVKRVCKNKCNSFHTVDEWLTEMRTCRDNKGNVVRTIPPCQTCSGSACPRTSKNAPNQP